jgi:hypothetical protein
MRDTLPLRSNLNRKSRIKQHFKGFIVTYLILNKSIDLVQKD